MKDESRELYSEFKVDPASKIEKAIEKEDYISASALAVSYFEHFGFLILRKRLKGIIKKDHLDSLNAHSIIIFLRALDIIKEYIYKDMMKIKNLRNNLVHQKSKKIYAPSENQISSLKKSRKCIDDLLELI